MLFLSCIIIIFQTRGCLPHTRTGNYYNFSHKSRNNDNNNHQCRSSDNVMIRVENGKNTLITWSVKMWVVKTNVGVVEKYDITLQNGYFNY